MAEGDGPRGDCVPDIRQVSSNRGSLKEVETQVFIAERLAYISGQASANLIELTAEVGRLISGLTKSLKRKSI